MSIVDRHPSWLTHRSGPFQRADRLKIQMLEKNVPPCFCGSFGNDSESSLHVLLSRRKIVSLVAIAFQSFQEQRQSGYTTFGRAVAILTLMRISWVEGKCSFPTLSEILGICTESREICFARHPSSEVGVVFSGRLILCLSPLGSCSGCKAKMKSLTKEVHQRTGSTNIFVLSA